MRIGELPADAQARLKAAAAVADPVQRRIAIDNANRWIDDTYPQYLKRNDAMRLMLQNVRLAFPALFEAVTVNGEGKPSFSAIALLPPGHSAIAQIEAAIAEVARVKWGAKADAVLTALRAGGKTCLHDGNVKGDYEGFAGNLYVSARSQTRPLVIGADKAPLVAADGRPYAGCYVNMSVELWAQDNGYGKRVNAQLRGVQFLRDGDAFAGGRPAEPDDFDDMTAGSDAEALV